MGNKQMITQRYFQNVEVDDKRTSFDLKQLLSTLNSMESYGSFIAVPNTSISVIVSQVFYDELLPNVDGLVDIFC